jgi:hypothetical protein
MSWFGEERDRYKRQARGESSNKVIEIKKRQARGESSNESYRVIEIKEASQRRVLKQDDVMVDERCDLKCV